jgi:hypothetical protein
VIDEQVLERALRDAAATYVPPPDGPARVLAAAAASPLRGPARGSAPRGSVQRRRTGWLAAAALVVGVGVAAAVAVPAARQADQFGGTMYRSQFLDSDKGGVQATNGPSVVRTGEVVLEVPHDRVATVLREVARVSTAHRGFVAESSATTSGDYPNGTVTLRVPVADFERVVDEVGRLGTVRSSTAQGEDVTGQVTDTAARLKTLGATREQLRTLLARAKDVGEVLAVQERLTEVQTQIEQLQAKQKSLADTTSYATVSVSVAPPGTGEPGGFARAWHAAGRRFVGGFEGLVAASGTLAFLLLVLGALGLAGRFAYRRVVRRIV